MGCFLLSKKETIMIAITGLSGLAPALRAKIKGAFSYRRRIGNLKPFIVAGIGEVLWDVFPENEIFGGAPANFSIHCSGLGANSFVLGSIGCDSRGVKALDFLQQRGVNTRLLQQHSEVPTGIVEVNLDPYGQPSYVIEKHSAWDELLTVEYLDMFPHGVDAVCFGTLAQRNKTTRLAIRSLLSQMPTESLSVFDINLRQSYFSRELIERSLVLADVLKLNSEELKVVSSLLGLSGSIETLLRVIMNDFELQLIALTRGKDGAFLISKKGGSDRGGLDVDVIDTVGAGDAYTSALVMGYLNRWSMEKINLTAIEISAWVCTREGAVPEIPKELADLFR